MSDPPDGFSHRLERVDDGIERCSSLLPGLCISCFFLPQRIDVCLESSSGPVGRAFSRQRAATRVRYSFEDSTYSDPFSRSGSNEIVLAIESYSIRLALSRCASANCVLRDAIVAVA